MGIPFDKVPDFSKSFMFSKAIASESLGDISFNNTDSLGWEYLDGGSVIHAWNTYDSYYFNKSNGIQFSNHYLEYWTRNVLMLGYYSGDTWNLIYRTDKLSGFSQDFNGSTDSYMNWTLWKDLSYGGYSFRLAIRYHLEPLDGNLTVIPYIKNLGVAIPYVLGFGWELKDIRIGNSFENDFFRTEQVDYSLHNSSLNETYTGLMDSTFWLDNHNDMTLIDKQLYLHWDGSLNYKLTVVNRSGQYNAPVTLFIRVGTLGVGQEKYTNMTWYDADINYGLSYKAHTGTVAIQQITYFDEDLFAIAYLDGNAGMLIAGKVTDTVITYGTAVTVAADTSITTGKYIDVCKVNYNTVAVVYSNDTDANDGGYVNIYEVDKDTLSLTRKDYDVFETGLSQYGSCCYAGNNKFAIFYNDYDDSIRSKCVVCTWSGIATTVGSATRFSALSDNAGIYYDSCYIHDDKVGVVFFLTEGSASNIQAFVGTISDTTPSFGTICPICSTSNSRYPSICSPDDDCLVFAYGNNTGATVGEARAGTCTGSTTISLGGVTTFDTDLPDICRCKAVNDTTFFIVYADSGDSYYGKSVKGVANFGAKTITFNSAETFVSKDTFSTYCPDIAVVSPYVYVVSYVNDTDDDDLYSIVGKSPGTFEGCYALNYDAYLHSIGETWDNAYEGLDVFPENTTTMHVKSVYIDKEGFYIDRSYLSFDTSNLPDNATVTGAYLWLYGTALEADGSTLCYMRGTQQDGTIDAGSWTEFDETPIYNESQFALGWNNISLSNIEDDISLTGLTKICVREDLYDYPNTAIEAESYFGAEFYSSTGTYPPYLVVTWEYPAAPTVASEEKTFGLNSVGGSTIFLEGNIIYGSNFTTPSSNTSKWYSINVSLYGNIYPWIIYDGNTANLSFAVYNDSNGSPHTLMARANQTVYPGNWSNANPEWITLSLEHKVLEPSTMYWLCFFSDTYVNATYNTATNHSFYKASTYASGFPSTLSGVTKSNYNFSICCTVNDTYASSAYNMTPYHRSQGIRCFSNFSVNVSSLNFPVTVNWWSNYTGSWAVWGTNSSIGSNSTVYQKPPFSLSSTKYWWKAEVNDGYGKTRNSSIYEFTTASGSPKNVVAYAGAYPLKGGPYYSDIDRQTFYEIVADEGYYTNSSHHNQTYINIVARAYSAYNITTAQLHLVNNDTKTWDNTSIFSINATLPYYTILTCNKTGLSHGNYSFDIYTSDGTNTTTDAWEKYVEDETNSTTTRRHVELGCTLNVTLSHYSLYLRDYPFNYSTGKYDNLPHDGGPDGGMYDSGMMVKAEPTTTMEHVWCGGYYGFWWEEGITPQQTSINSVYISLWWWNDGGTTMELTLGYGKGQISVAYGCPKTLSMTTGTAVGSDTYAGHPIYHSVGFLNLSEYTYNVDSNNIYNYFMGTPLIANPPHSYCNTTYRSFIIINPFTNSTLNNTDSDGDGYNDYQEMYVSHTDPFYSGDMFLNTLPTVTGEYPTNGSINQPLQLAVGCTVNDVNSNQTINATFSTNITGMWIDMQTNSSLASGSKINWTYIEANTANTHYFWRVTVDDGNGNATYFFDYTTADNWTNIPPVAIGEHPTNGSTNQPVQLAVGCTIRDSNSNHTMNVTFATNVSGAWVNQQTNSSVANNSAVNWTYSQANSKGINYWWRVYVHDGFSNQSYTFYYETTNTMPTATGEHPTNGSTNQLLGMAVGCTVNDADTGHTINATFATNESGSFINMQTNSSLASGTGINWTYYSANVANTRYWWRVYLSDGYSNQSYTFYFNTADNWTNVAPVISGEQPSNESTGIGLTPACGVTLTDGNSNHTFNVTYASNYSNGIDWVNYQTNSSITNGSATNWTFSGASSYGTRYWWQVYCHDGFTNISKIYCFTTLTDTTSPTISLHYAGSSVDGNYTNASIQVEDFMIIDCVILDNVGVVNASLNWSANNVWSNTTYYLGVNSSGHWIINQTNVTSNVNYSFDVYAKDASGNGVLYMWNCTYLDGSDDGRKFVSLCGTPVDIDYTIYYIWNATYVNTLTEPNNEVRLLQHQQGVNLGGIEESLDSGYLSAELPTDTYQARNCYQFWRAYINDNLCISSFQLDNVYSHLWLNHSAVNSSVIGYKKTIANLNPDTVGWDASNVFNFGFPPSVRIQQNVRFDTVAYDKLFALNTTLITDATPSSYVDNDIYQLSYGQDDNAGSNNPCVFSNRSMLSFIILNVPDNESLPADTDGDGVSDRYELYHLYTNPFVSDTDNDGVSDYDENISGSDPNNYTSAISLADIDVDVCPDTWLSGEVYVNNFIQENFTFYQNGSTTIDVTIGINNTNYTFVTYDSWLSLGHDRYCANFTTDNWVSETNIAPGYPPTTVLKTGLGYGSFVFGVRIWMPRTVTYSNKKEDFEIVLTVSVSS